MGNFNDWSVDDFNDLGTQLNENMTFAQAVDNMDENEISYFYVSMLSEDVLEAIENEEEIAKQLGLHLIYIKDLGIYIATY